MTPWPNHYTFKGRSDLQWPRSPTSLPEVHFKGKRCIRSSRQCAALSHDLDKSFGPTNLMLPWPSLPHSRKRDAIHSRMRSICLDRDIINESRNTGWDDDGSIFSTSTSHVQLVAPGVTALSDESFPTALRLGRPLMGNSIFQG
ncbi:hypothetical protein PDE_03355 [Penicillium oxalicum 114-2]|uniref:Uncharacterized protein n=1 Tax=Penicillium oxalicum (strain 114-2 / CGMCC 5302) TaxID=933388 RepID=S7ZDR3_PENO1|nr:hypothetical protein PDE_03355 [Penicillium oxalicum 114-2]